MKRESGLTLGELLICVAVVLIIGSAVIGGIGSCGADYAAALKAATEYADNLGEIKSLTCASQDSDGDGYCSCDLITEKGEILTLDCGCQRYGCVKARGCKLTQRIKAVTGKGAHSNRTNRY